MHKDSNTMKNAGNGVFFCNYNNLLFDVTVSGREAPYFRTCAALSYPLWLVSIGGVW